MTAHVADRHAEPVIGERIEIQEVAADGRKRAVNDGNFGYFIGLGIDRKKLHLPLPALRNILKRLTQQGFLTSTQGPKGGYHLARRPEQITLGQLVEAIDGPVHLAMCCPVPAGVEQPQCQLEASCRIKESVRQVHSGLVNYLDQVTLADIAFARVGSALNPVGVIAENV